MTSERLKGTPGKGKRKSWKSGLGTTLTTALLILIITTVSARRIKRQHPDLKEE
ncbi:MAG: hypothetical protein MUO76_19655 [Anaerolineaceae bacterium]|nr:hypothetical protein [Anaerolineaceae bacterium]